MLKVVQLMHATLTVDHAGKIAVQTTQQVVISIRVLETLLAVKTMGAQIKPCQLRRVQTTNHKRS